MESTWIPVTEEMLGRKTHEKVYIDGKTPQQICKERGVKYETFKYRYYQLGWSVEDALSEEKHVKKRLSRSKKYEYKGETGHLAYFATKYNINYSTLYKRVSVYHWDIIKAIETPSKRK